MEAAMMTIQLGNSQIAECKPVDLKTEHCSDVSSLKNHCRKDSIYGPWTNGKQ